MTPKKRQTSFMDVPQEETRGKGKDGIEKREAHGSISTLAYLYYVTYVRPLLRYCRRRPLRRWRRYRPVANPAELP